MTGERTRAYALAVFAGTRYAASGDVSIAYQVIGHGLRDLIFIPGIISHVEFFHELPDYPELIEGRAGFAPVVVFDKRSNGLSDRVVGSRFPFADRGAHALKGGPDTWQLFAVMESR